MIEKSTFGTEKKNNNNNNETRIFHKQGAANADPNRSYISAILDAKAADSHTFFFLSANVKFVLK